MTDATDLPRLEEFAHWLGVARKHGWSVPDPDRDSHGPAAWVHHWKVMEHARLQRLRGENAGRPVVPHTVGTRGPEDTLQRAERINRNRDLWRGYLT